MGSVPPPVLLFFCVPKPSFFEGPSSKTLDAHFVAACLIYSFIHVSCNLREGWLREIPFFSFVCVLEQSFGGIMTRIEFFYCFIYIGRFVVVGQWYVFVCRVEMGKKVVCLFYNSFAQRGKYMLCVCVCVIIIIIISVVLIHFVCGQLLNLGLKQFYTTRVLIVIGAVLWAQ